MSAACRLLDTPSLESALLFTLNATCRHDDPDGVLAWLEEKIAAVTMLPLSHHEVRGVLRCKVRKNACCQCRSFPQTAPWNVHPVHPSTGVADDCCRPRRSTCCIIASTSDTSLIWTRLIQSELRDAFRACCCTCWPDSDARCTRPAACREFGPQPSQRMATMLVYLSDVEEGGETVFKREGKDGERGMHALCMHAHAHTCRRLHSAACNAALFNQHVLPGCCAGECHAPGADKAVTDWTLCEPHEFKYKPRLGDAVLFYRCVTCLRDLGWFMHVCMCAVCSACAHAVSSCACVCCCAVLHVYCRRPQPGPRPHDQPALIAWRLQCGAGREVGRDKVDA